MNTITLPTEIDLLIIDFLKLQDIINLASVNHYFHNITSSYLEKYYEFNDKCKSTIKEYEINVGVKYDKYYFVNTILADSISFGHYNICEFVFSKYEHIDNHKFELSLMYACDLGKADIVQLVIDNWRKVKHHNFTIRSKSGLFKALCKHKYTNVLELISPYFDLYDYSGAFGHVIETNNNSMFEALIVQDSFQINNDTKSFVAEKINNKEISRAIMLLLPYISNNSTADVIKNELAYEVWFRLFETPYAINKIKHKKLILQNLNN